MTRRTKILSIEDMAIKQGAASKREDENMLRKDHVTFFYDSWYERRGKGIVEARDKAARADREAYSRSLLGGAVEPAPVVPKSEPPRVAKRKGCLNTAASRKLRAQRASEARAAGSKAGGGSGKLPR